MNIIELERKIENIFSNQYIRAELSAFKKHGNTTDNQNPDFVIEFEQVKFNTIQESRSIKFHGEIGSRDPKGNGKVGEIIIFLYEDGKVLASYGFDKWEDKIKMSGKYNLGQDIIKLDLISNLNSSDIRPIEYELKVYPIK